MNSRNENPAYKRRASQISTFQSICLLFAMIAMGNGCKSEESNISKLDLQRYKAHPKAVQFLIEAEYALKNDIYNLALSLLDSAKHYAPDLADVFFLQGMAYTELSDFDKARQAYDKVRSLDASYPGLYLNLGNIAFRMGEIQTALDFYRSEKDSSIQNTILLYIGRSHAALGNVDSARHAYLQTIANDSTSATAYMRLAQLYKDEGELAIALKYARKGLRFQPDNPNYQYIVAVTLLLAEKPEEASVYLKSVVQKRPWHYWSNYKYGEALMRSSREKMAKKYFAAAESLQVQIKQIEDWRRMAENNPDQQGIWINYGDALARANRIEEAIHAHNVALSVGPAYFALQSNLATLYMLNGDTTKALSIFESILRQDSTFADAWLNLGVAYANSGNTAGAKGAWQQALKYAPDDTLASAYLKRLLRSGKSKGSSSGKLKQ